MEQSNLEDFQNVLQSVNGWGLYWDNYSPTQFDDDANGMTLLSQVGDRIDYYFMLGGSADGVIAQMRHLTGDVPMFPLWTFGYWQSKERYKTSDELLSVVSKYRELHVPLDGIIQDWQYWGSNYLWNAMDFLSEDFAQGAQMVKKAHDRSDDKSIPSVGGERPALQFPNLAAERTHLVAAAYGISFRSACV